MTYNTWIVLLGTSLLGLSAGVVGCFAVLRRRALLGDALGHATLPGLGLAFWLTGERSLPVLLLGALVSGVAGILVMAVLRRWTRLREDVGIALVLSVFFGAGAVLQSLIQNRAGSGQSGLKTFLLGNTATINQADVQFLGTVALVALFLVAILFKEFQLVVFDTDFAQVQGWPAGRLDFLLMLLVAGVLLIGLPAVGVMLTAALLVVPASASRFWTQRLSWRLMLSGIFGMISGMVGTLLSARFADLPAGPTIILVAAGLFFLSYFIGPNGGWLKRRRTFRQDLVFEEPAP